MGHGRGIGFKGKLNRASAAFLLLLTSCLFETRVENPSDRGFFSLEISLKPTAGALLKAASADTLFSLDTLKIILSSPGSSGSAYAYPISGRADTGNITVTPKIYALAPLRTWKAKIIVLDTSLNPSRTDTVYLDSVSFAVNPGDTAFVAKTVNPAFAILRSRLVSNSPASVANNVKWVRLRVDGTTRDSMPVGPALRSLSYGNSNTGIAVGDSGIIVRTANSGTNWASAASGTTANLNGVSFPSTNTGYAVGDAGAILKTTTGTAWTAQASGTTRNLNGTFFTSGSAGYAVGDAGTIRISNGSAWASAAATGTASNLNGVYSTSASTGYAVGDAGAIVKTTNSGADWSALSSGTARNLNAVFFPSASTGYVVGDSGTILKTANGGAAWSVLSSGTTKKLSGIYFTSATAGYAVGDAGTVLRTTDGTAWTSFPSGTSQDLHAVCWTTNGGAGAAIGNEGAMLISSNGASWSLQSLGTKSFDMLLTYKYLKPNVSHTLIMDAIDTLAGALRGYQAAKTISLSAGKDTTVTPVSSLVKCGYSGFSACTP